MLTSAIRQVFNGVVDLRQRAERAMLALAAERRCALRLDRLSTRLVDMGERISLLRNRMEGGGEETVDPEGELGAALKGFKEDIREIRRQLRMLEGPQQSARLQRAFSRLHGIAEQTYAGADQLQWEIVEHDGQLIG